MITRSGTGATGKQLIEQALAAGNQVVAFARNPSRISASHERLTIVQGELTDTAAIVRAVSGADAAISVLGPRAGEDIHSRPLTQGMQNILAAMQKTNVRRLIISSTPSAGDPNDLPHSRFKALVAIVKSAMRPAYEEIVNVARIVRDSDTDLLPSRSGCKRPGTACASPPRIVLPILPPITIHPSHPCRATQKR